jgi:hypothetical protein
MPPTAPLNWLTRSHNLLNPAMPAEQISTQIGATPGMLNKAEVPDRLIYEADDGAIPSSVKRTLLGLATLAVAAILLLSRIRLITRRLRSALGTPKLSAVMAVVFVCLSIPILIFILVYSYHRNSAAIVSLLHEEVTKTQQSSIENADNLIRPVASTLKLLAGTAAADPAFFRTEKSREPSPHPARRVPIPPQHRRRPPAPHLQHVAVTGSTAISLSCDFTECEYAAYA